MRSSSQKMSPSTSQHPVFYSPSCRPTNSVKHRMKTEQRITITVLGDVVPGWFVHVVLVVSGKNLFLHRFVTAVWTEWRISSQTEHAQCQRQCRSYIYTAFSTYRPCREFQASTQNCNLHGGVLCPSIDNVNCIFNSYLSATTAYCSALYFILFYRILLTVFLSSAAVQF